MTHCTSCQTNVTTGGLDRSELSPVPVATNLTATNLPPAIPPDTYRESIQRWSLALVDQAVVSGTRFLTTIFVGRAAGAEELGRYSIAFMAFILLGCVQEALVTTPYAVHYHRLRRRTRAVYAGSSLVFHLLLALCCGVIISAVAGLSWAEGHHPQFTRLSWILAATIPLSLMWEFARRSMLAQLEVASVVRLDATAAAVQIIGLSVLASTGLLTATSALLVIAAGSLFVALGWLNSSRTSRIIHWRLVMLYVRRNLRLGGWLVGAQIVGVLHSMVPTLMVAMLVNTTATGVFVAYLNFALLANPLMLAVANLLTPRTAQALKVEGIGAAARVVRNAALAMSGVLGCYCGLLAVWGDRVVALVYGTDFAGHRRMLIALGACTIAWSVSLAFAAGLSALRHARESFVATSIGTSVSALSIFLMVRGWSVGGAAAGLLAGSTVAAALHILFFVLRYRAQLVPGDLRRGGVAELSVHPI